MRRPLCPTPTSPGRPIFWVKMTLLAVAGAASFFPTTIIIQRAIEQKKLGDTPIAPMSRKLFQPLKTDPNPNPNPHPHSYPHRNRNRNLNPNSNPNSNPNPHLNPDQVGEAGGADDECPQRGAARILLDPARRHAHVARRGLRGLAPVAGA